MNPEREIDAYLRSKGVQRAVLNDMLRGFAHDLAEAQRAHLRGQGYDLACACEGCTACIAKEYIDLIDPEANGQGVSP